MKNRTVQLIFQSVYCTLALVACIGSTGFFDHKYTGEFIIYFTNISCYVCTGIMLAELVQTARREENGYVSAVPCLHFIGMLGLILTFLVFNILIVPDPARNPALNFKVECILCHIVLPIMFTADWLLFYERGKVKWTWPFLSALYPLAYLGFIFIHAAALHFDSTIMNYAGTDPIIYPYFFLNPERVGIGGIIAWVFGLLAAFLIGGFLFMLVDRLAGKIRGGRNQEK